MASLVSGSLEMEVILRDLGRWFTPLLGRVSEHANEPLPTSHFQILKHLKGKDRKFLDWKVPWGRGRESLLSLGQESRQVGQLLPPPAPLHLSFKLELWQNKTPGSAVGARCSLPVLTDLGQRDMHQPSP